MIIAKLVLFASPLLIASMLFFANPVAASPINSASTKTHINTVSVSSKSTHQLITLNQTDKSNPILDNLACQCAYCTKAKLQLEGKLSISSIL
ncbi:MAG: hypothetical protein VKN72_01530 [Nostocales cyanobacterium 94392]|nr:hypothetical protein [Nostocales cyanobacterium 94392]